VADPNKDPLTLKSEQALAEVFMAVATGQIKSIGTCEPAFLF
jgi:hypothetical protein